MSLLAQNAFRVSYKVDGEPPKPQYWLGGSLAHMGTHGERQEPSWRVVWSDSIRYMFRATNSDTYKWIPSYRGVHAFVLERWLTPYQYDKCTEEGWNLKNKLQGDLGAYPSTGAWFGPCKIFEDVPTIGAVEASIRLILQGDLYTEEQKRQAIIESDQKDESLRIRRCAEKILGTLPLDMTRGKLTNRFYNDAADIPEKYSAQDIARLTGMPLGERKSFTGGARRT